MASDQVPPTFTAAAPASSLDLGPPRALVSKMRRCALQPGAVGDVHATLMVLAPSQPSRSSQAMTALLGVRPFAHTLPSNFHGSPGDWGSWKLRAPWYASWSKTGFSPAMGSSPSLTLASFTKANIICGLLEAPAASADPKSERAMSPCPSKGLDVLAPTRTTPAGETAVISWPATSAAPLRMQSPTTISVALRALCSTPFHRYCSDSSEAPP